MFSAIIICHMHQVCEITPIFVVNKASQPSAWWNFLGGPTGHQKPEPTLRQDPDPAFRGRKETWAC